jgi:hypothetical protein
VGPRAGLDFVEKKKFLTLPGLELVQPIASHYTFWAIPALTLINNVISKNTSSLFEDV